MNHWIKTLRIGKFPLLAIAGLMIFLGGCYAEPSESDVDGVIRDFLVQRFRAPFSETYRNMSDRELMELSCSKNRVKCDRILQLIEKRDPRFYRLLMGSALPESTKSRLKKKREGR